MKIVIELNEEEFQKNQYRLKDYGYEILQRAFRDMEYNKQWDGVVHVAVAEIRVVK